MAQSSFLSSEADPAAALSPARRVQVLAPLPLARAYDYAVPEGMDLVPGDYVRIPLGKRETVAVVWACDAPDAAVPEKKLKQVLQKFDAPPMPQAQRLFVDRIARYTLSDAGSVLKMCVSAPEALLPQKQAAAYRLGQVSPAQKMSAHRKAIAELLSDGKPRRAADIARAANCSPAVIRGMAAVGLLLPVEEQARPADMPQPVADYAPVTLSQGQADAAKALRDLVAAEKYTTALLDGVTGSGKTEVYFEAVAQALSRGKQALILLPEISLSAQFLDRFEKRFGAPPVIWHSEVTPVQRRNAWAAVADGRAKVVIGARSALFLPFADLGLIVVDEEHEASYKQEEGVLYNARDMAVLRANLGAFPVVLVSATPSLETMTNAQSGKYAYLSLPSRHAGAAMPDVRVVDLKTDKPGRQKFISPPLAAALAETFAAGDQSLLFLNRRGYAPLTLCRACGYRFQCPSCSAWLVDHRRLGKMQCHHCGHGQNVPSACPGCGEAESLAPCGPGVERIQEEAQELLPDARIMVLASDIVTSPNMIRDAVREIEEGRVDIIIGTQIVAKGHHFPSLTCVGVVDADLGLAGGDLRAGERTFQLLHQVSGRAGRGQKPGRVFIQTYMPEQNVIRALAANDRDRFLAVEAQERARAGMPPFGKLAAVIVSGADEVKLDHFCRALVQKAPQVDDVRVLGPAPAPLAYLRGKHRRRFLVKAGKATAIQAYISAWLAQFRVPSAFSLKVDIDPQSFF